MFAKIKKWFSDNDEPMLVVNDAHGKDIPFPGTKEEAQKSIREALEDARKRIDELPHRARPIVQMKRYDD